MTDNHHPYDGWTGRWTRRPEVEAQIATLTPRAIVPVLELHDKDDPRYVHTETLVALVRRLQAAGRWAEAGDMAGEIVLRAGRIAGGVARVVFPQNADLRDDLVEAVQEKILVALQDPAQEFLEASFGFYVRRRCQSIYQQMQVEANREQAISMMPGYTDNDGDELPQREFFIEADPAGQIVGQLALRDMLAQLPNNVQQAVYLVYEVGYHVESNDPAEMTVSRILGVTGRSVRNYLRRGEAAIRDWHEQEMERDGQAQRRR